MSHVRAPSPDYPQQGRITGTGYRETAAGPGPGLGQAASFVGEPYGQDFSLRVGSQDNHPPLRFANTDVLDQVEPLTIANRASVLRSRELRRLFIAAVAWTVNAVVRWNTRHGQRRRLNDLPDHLLRDMGIRRDQIDAMVSGSLQRGTRP